MSALKRTINTPTGISPAAKVTSYPRKLSQKQRNLIQKDLDEQLKAKYTYCPSKLLLIDEISSNLQYAKGINPSRHGALRVAIKRVFPNVKTFDNKPGLIQGICIKGQETLATPLSTSISSENRPTKENIPSTNRSLFASESAECDCKSKIIRRIQSELKDIAGYALESKLRCSDLESFNILELREEFVQRIPTLHDILTKSVLRNTDTVKNYQKKQNGLLTALCKILFIYNEKLNAYSKIAAIKERQVGCTREGLTMHNKLYNTVSYVSTNSTLDQYAQSSDARLAELAGKVTIHCGDNVDKRQKKRHELNSKSVNDLHMYNNLLYEARIDVSGLDDSPHKPDIEQVDLRKFYPSNEEQQILISGISHHVAETWRHIKTLSQSAKELSKIPEHKYSTEMARKTNKAHIGVLLKNEGNPNDMIEILQHCNKYPSATDTKKALYRGDAYTYDKVKPALSAMANSSEKLKFIPSFGDFHLQMTWVQAIFDRYYIDSPKDVAALHALKVVTESSQVKADAKENYWACSFFLNKVLDGYLLAAALKMFNLKDCDDDSTQYTLEQVKAKIDEFLQDLYRHEEYQLPESNSCPYCPKPKKYVHLTSLKKHIETKHPGAAVCATTEQEISSDTVAGYSRELIKMLLLKRHLDKGIKAGDGAVVYICVKSMYLYFYVLGNTKYRLVCMEMIAQVEFFLSDRMRELVLYERFVNNLGKKAGNIPMDQDVEFCNRDFKNNFKCMYGEPSDVLLERLSKASDDCAKILANFAQQLGVEEHHAARKVKDEVYYQDVKKICKVIDNAKVFHIQPQRLMANDKLNRAALNPLRTLNLYEMKGWLLERLRVMSFQTFYKY